MLTAQLFLAQIVLGSAFCGFLSVWILFPLLVASKVKCTDFLKSHRLKKPNQCAVSVATCFACGILLSGCLFQILPLARNRLAAGLFVIAADESARTDPNVSEKLSGSALSAYRNKASRSNGSQLFVECFVVIGFVLCLCVTQFVSDVKFRITAANQKAKDEASELGLAVRQASLQSADQSDDHLLQKYLSTGRRRSLSAEHHIDGLKKPPAIQRLLNDPLGVLQPRRTTVAGYATEHRSKSGRSNPMRRSSPQVGVWQRQKSTVDGCSQVNSSGGTVSSDDDEIWEFRDARIHRCNSCMISSTKLSSLPGEQEEAPWQCVDNDSLSQRPVSSVSLIVVICLGFQLSICSMSISHEGSTGAFLWSTGRLVISQLFYAMATGLVLVQQNTKLSHAGAVALAYACCHPIGIMLGIVDDVSHAASALRVFQGVVSSMAVGALLCVTTISLLSPEISGTSKTYTDGAHVQKRKVSSIAECTHWIDQSVDKKSKAAEMKFFTVWLGPLKVTAVFVGCLLQFLVIPIGALAKPETIG